MALLDDVEGGVAIVGKARLHRSPETPPYRIMSPRYASEDAQGRLATA
jgi:hypothetical protein